MRKAVSLCLALATLSLNVHASERKPYPNRPRLILVVVVDQMRADYLTRFRPKFGSAGFSKLMDQGAYYPFATYPSFQNMTGPGHSIILSGSTAGANTIPLNAWWDQKLSRVLYCVGDTSSPLVGMPGSQPDDRGGISPRNFTGSTLGDEIKNADIPSRLVSVSLKDRSAVLLGGWRADFALWFEPKSFQWVTSRFYLPEGGLPTWVQKLNTSVSKERGLPTRLGKMLKTVDVGSKDSLSFPFGVTVTTDAAIAALDEYQLGNSTDRTDILAVSYSSHDYLGHKYGPNSRELEEMTVFEDGEISRLLKAAISKTRGGERELVVVLTADHGVQPSPKMLDQTRIPHGEFPTEAWVKELNEKLTAKFGASKSGLAWIPAEFDLNFFIDERVRAERGVSEDQVDQFVARELEAKEGVARVLTRAQAPLDPLAKLQYVPGRSGQVIAVPKPFYKTDSDPVVHYTSYSYDRTVPLILWGKGIRTGLRSEAALVSDIAPTLSFLVGVVPPVQNVGRTLSESLSIR